MRAHAKTPSLFDVMEKARKTVSHKETEIARSRFQGCKFIGIFPATSSPWPTTPPSRNCSRNCHGERPCEDKMVGKRNEHWLNPISLFTLHPSIFTLAFTGSQWIATGYALAITRKRTLFSIGNRRTIRRVGGFGWSTKAILRG